MSSTVQERPRSPLVPTSSHWPRYPSIYEINTWVWLTELGRSAKRPIDLSSVPPDEWDRVGALGFDAVWFMGVWERSPAGIAIANRNDGLVADFRRALPDFRPDDNVGSPYCIRRYVVDRQLGGPEGLAIARQELARRGMRLMLDFVPNHVAPDHFWVGQHPEYFIQGTPQDLQKDPASFLVRAGRVFACGRDPFFPAWPDVLQLNGFDRSLRGAVRDTLSDIANQCDGVRCDMAMLLLSDVFARTWGQRAGPRPATEYWADVIPATKSAHPDFLFIAEAYWDLEWTLQQIGFDFCYDKRLYDRLEHDSPTSVRDHLRADPAYQDKLVRFLENHDEPRAAAAFPGVREHAAAVTALTLPGAKLVHEGQLEGRRVRLPVFLARRPVEPSDAPTREFYDRFIGIVTSPILRDGQWRLCEQSGWPDNNSVQNLVAWSWEQGEGRYLIVVNLSADSAQGRVKVEWSGVAGSLWRLTDVLTGTTYDRAGDEMSGAGLYVDLTAWGAHVFECRKRNTP